MIVSWQDRQAEERARFDFLMRLYQVTQSDPAQIVHGGDIGYAIGFSGQQTFVIVEFLANSGYIEYLGAGPKIRISSRGKRYIEWEAETRQTIR